MDTLTARPQLLKQANLALIRKVIKSEETATRAEITARTRISSTTVRSLLTEMLQSGEIESIGYDESSGGRKAERYRLNPNRYYSAVFCITGHKIHGLLVNVCGEILEIADLKAEEEDYEAAIITFLDGLVTEKEIKSIGVGVPGIVEGGSYWRQKEQKEELFQTNLGDHLAARYHVPVLLENDLNAIVYGFKRCYEQEFPRENPEETSMAYLHFEPQCISAGFMMGSRMIRGSNRFAGELGLIPMDDGRLLEEWISDASDDKEYSDLVVKIICWICGILNPRYVALGGPGFRKDCLSSISDGIFAVLPEYMQADILYSPDVWHDYHSGMAQLTAARIFDEIQFIKE